MNHLPRWLVPWYGAYTMMRCKVLPQCVIKAWKPRCIALWFGPPRRRSRDQCYWQMNTVLAWKMWHISGGVPKAMWSRYRGEFQKTWLGGIVSVNMKVRANSVTGLIVTIPSASSASSFIASRRGLTSSQPERAGSKRTVTCLFAALAPLTTYENDILCKREFFP